jgi:hypothetical protein
VAELVAELAHRFGGYAAWWRYAARRLAEDDGSEDEIPLPLYEHNLWGDWVAGEVHAEGVETPPFQSGALSAVMARTSS